MKIQNTSITMYSCKCIIHAGLYHYNFRAKGNLKLIFSI